MSRSRRLERIEGFAAQQERRNGEPLPVLEPSTDQNSPAREQFRQRLDEMGSDFDAMRS
jgi:hypothetical protein